MVIPLVAIVIAAVLTVVGGVLYLNWDAILIALTGKRVAVLGARGVGKTHLVKFLTTGTIPAEYKQTVAPEKTPSRRFSLKDLDLKVKESLDLSGDKAAYAVWKELHAKADVVFYLLRADRLIAGDEKVENRVRDDLTHISNWIKDRGESPPRFFIIGTHCDLDPEFKQVRADTIGDYVDKFRKLPIVLELVARAGGTAQTTVVLGSMKTVQDTAMLVFQVFVQVQS